MLKLLGSLAGNNTNFGFRRFGRQKMQAHRVGKNPLGKPSRMQRLRLC
jgi:hypothetical protein